MKKLLAVLVVLITVLSILPLKVSAEDELNLTAKSAVLIDAKTGEVLYENNSHERRPFASVTKVMTMLLVMEKIASGQMTYQDQVTITATASQMGGTQLFLEPGEIRTVEELLYGTAVESANDAATALGEHVSGTLEGFVSAMNEKAALLGLNDTHFLDACGLTDEGHYSSAYDISIISKELLKYEEILRFTNTWMHDITIGKNNDVKRTLANTNRLISQCDYIDGLKTGYTSKSGHCMSVTGIKGSLRLIGVVMASENSSTRFNDAKTLLDYGFAKYKADYPVKKNSVVSSLEILNGNETKVDLCASDDIYRIVPIDANTQCELEIVLEQTSRKAPVKQGDVVGKVIVRANGEQIGECDIYIANDVNKTGYFKYLKRMLPILF